VAVFDVDCAWGMTAPVFSSLGRHFSFRGSKFHGPSRGRLFAKP
jgi:hypothetical protein